MPYQFESYHNPFALSIAQLLEHRGDIGAQQAIAIGNAQARAQELDGQIWGQAIGQIGQQIGQIPGQIQAAKDAEQRRQLVGNQVQQSNIALAGQQQQQQGQGIVDAALRGDQLPPGDAGPRQPSYLDDQGLFDIGKITTELNRNGLGHLAPDLVKGAEQINDSVLKHAELVQKTAQAQSVTIGDMAAGALKLAQTGTPLPDAMDFVVQPGLASKTVDAQQYAQIRARIASLPPQQQQAALTALMDQAAKIAPTKVLAEGSQEVDRYGRQIATGAPKPPTEPELALQATGGDPVAAMDRLKPPPKKTEGEQAMDAFAQSLGKKDGSQLTYQERQRYAAAQAKLTSDQAFTQHQRERQYDIANPVPEKAKNQDALEQEYRTVLTRAMSSRSGGVGLEDAKVQQANHLLALLDQNYDAKSNTYNIPSVQQTELAMGLAKLVAPGGNVGVQMERDINQATAKGDLAKALTYITGSPVNATTQDLVKMYRDSILRQGEVAQQNREGEMAYLRGLAPTGLDETRRQALETTSLNPLRLSRLAVDGKGNSRLFISTDGGKTWK